MTGFLTHELVCPHVYKKYGDRSLQFADPRLLFWLDWFRKEIGKPVTVNTYGYSGKYSQRGYRCNMCSLVKDKTAANIMYLSAHTRFQAVDFNVAGMSDEEVRQWIYTRRHEMPCHIRVELDTAGWTHVDVVNDTDAPIIYFNG